MSELLTNYAHDDVHYHEMLDENGHVRPHWQALVSHLERYSPEQLSQRQALLARQIQENGITYNVYADPEGADRPWQLDLIPNIIPANEWQKLSAAVAQRATLLNELLADIYGEQTLIAEGLLPADLVFGHNNYLWPCQGIKPLGGTWLHLYAVDLVRAADGRWIAIADRTQAPSGAGYALENRHIIARAFPELYRDLRVQYIAGYFRTLQDTLVRQAPTEPGEIPLIVLLTPGRFNESYFEHLFLARQLGYPLVEGSDLTVRDATVYLKTLDGLKRVHAILRRLDDNYCDSLELRTDSILGVPGLLEAVRQERVLMANALGSGVLESPGLPGFLPAICQRLLGESLQLPSIDSWWCGEPPVLEEALERLSDLLVRGTFPSQRFTAQYGGNLNKDSLNKLAERVQQRPYAYVGQALPEFSSAPVWSEHNNALDNMPISLRVFAVAGPDGYCVMPGGLTRTAKQHGHNVLSMQRGGVSKDTWILGEQHSPRGAPWQMTRRLNVADIVRGDPYMPSRMVENLFWFGRYCERCESNARLLRILLGRHVDGSDAQTLGSATTVARSLGLLPEALAGENLPVLLQRALCDRNWPFSLHSNLHNLHWSATSVRGKLSRENWQALLGLHKDIQSLETTHDAGELLEFLDCLLMSLSAQSGFALDDMTRDISWRFLMIGRRIERLQFITESLAAFLRVHAHHEQASLDWLLELGNSSITYRTRYLAAAQAIPVIDLLVLDDYNPHAVMFQLRMLQRSLDAFEKHRDDLPAAQGLSELMTRLRQFDLSGLYEEANTDVPEELASLLISIATESGHLSDQLGLRFFVHVDISQQTQSL